MIALLADYDCLRALLQEAGEAMENMSRRMFVESMMPATTKIRWESGELGALHAVLAKTAKGGDYTDVISTNRVSAPKKSFTVSAADVAGAYQMLFEPLVILSSAVSRRMSMAATSC